MGWCPAGKEPGFLDKMELSCNPRAAAITPRLLTTVTSSHARVMQRTSGPNIGRLFRPCETSREWLSSLMWQRAPLPESAARSAFRRGARQTPSFACNPCQSSGVRVTLKPVESELGSPQEREGEGRRIDEVCSPNKTTKQIAVNDTISPGVTPNVSLRIAAIGPSVRAHRNVNRASVPVFN